MKRFVWGIVLATLGALAIIGGLTGPSSNPGGVVGGVLMAAAGGVLTHFGNQYRERRKHATEIALQMLRQAERIDAAELGRQLGVSEVDIRGYIAESQKTGLIPLKADIV